MTLFIGLTASFTVKLIGTIQVSEIVMIVILPFLLVTQPQKAFRRGLRAVYFLMGLWLVGQILTDIYRGTPQHNWMRGDARIIFFALNLATLVILLTKHVRRQILFFAAYGIGSLMAARFQPSDAMSDYPWKFGYAEGTMVLVILASCYFHHRRQYWAAGSLLGGLVVANLLQNFRSPILSLMITIALVIPVVPERIGRMRLLPPAGTPKRAVALILFAVAFAALSGGLVEFVTDVGLIGSSAREKNLAQAHSLAGLLLGGRPEILVSSRAVMESPILGHGSWAEDLKYTEMLHDVAIKYDIPTDNLAAMEDSADSQIPAHSHIMSTWVQSGILGAVFWAYILWIVLKGLIRTALIQPPLSPYYTWLLAGFVWDVFFSPFGNTRRSIDSLVILIVMDVMETYPVARGYWNAQRRGKWRRVPNRAERTANATAP